MDSSEVHGPASVKRASRLRGVRFNWNALARRDPWWAVLTRPEKRAGGWDPAEFYATGEVLVEQVLSRFTALGAPTAGGRALDFGCGVGRTCSALRRHFDEVLGLDLAEEMLGVARRHVTRSGVRFVHTRAGDLEPVAGERFELVWSFITLQHVPPWSQRALLADLAAAVTPGGALFVQLPERSHSDPARVYGDDSWRGRLRRWLPAVVLERYRSLRNRGPRMDMFGLPPADVARILSGAGLQLLAADAVDDADGLVPSRRYFAARSATAR